MFKLALISLISLPLFAGFFPAAVHTSITDVDKKTVKLKNAFPLNGMSGVVIHSYGQGTQAITHYVIQTQKDGLAKVAYQSAIDHKKLPEINTPVSNKDQVIGGYMYDNVLLLAPDSETYSKLTKQYKKHWIHPDLYALFLATEGDEVPTRENLAKFAMQNQVGLVMIIQKGTAILFDPVSRKIINTMKIGNLPKKGSFPFYTRLKDIDSGWFDMDEDEKDYYQTMNSL